MASTNLTSTQVSESDVYPGFDCIIVNSPSVVCGVIATYSFACLLITIFGLYAVIFHYCASKDGYQILLKLRIFSIMGTVFILLFDYDAVVDTYFAMKCDLSPNSYMAKYDDYGTIVSGLGYYCLYVLFVLKLKHSFQDTLFEISQTYLKILTIGGIIGMICIVFGAIMFISKQESFGLMFNGTAILLLIFGNIVLAKTLFCTLYDYLHYKHLDDDGDVTNRKGNAGNGEIEKYKIDINSKDLQAFVRLVVVYSSAILSSFLITIIWIVTRRIMLGNKELYNQWAMWSRLLLICDSFINIPCLLFQNTSAIKLYHKSCCVCHSCVIKPVEKKINQDINNNLKNMKEIKVNAASFQASVNEN